MKAEWQKLKDWIAESKYMRENSYGEDVKPNQAHIRLAQLEQGAKIAVVIMKTLFFADTWHIICKVHLRNRLVQISSVFNIKDVTGISWHTLSQRGRSIYSIMILSKVYDEVQP